MGWKTPKVEYVNGYRIVELEGPTFKVYDGDRQLGEDFPYSGEAAAHAKSLPTLDFPALSRISERFSGISSSAALAEVGLKGS